MKQKKHLRRSKRGAIFCAGSILGGSKKIKKPINLLPHLVKLRKIAIANAPPGTVVQTHADTKTGIISSTLYDIKTKNKIGQIRYKVLSGGKIIIETGRKNPI